jgi:small conductance mechanosensitive channel
MKEFFVTVWDQHAQYLLGIGRNLFIAALIILGGRLITVAADKMLRKAAKSKLKIDDTMAAVLHLIIKYGVTVLSVLMVLENFGVSTTSLIALLSAAGITIGLSLRNTLSNIASGIILFVLRPYHQGDFIEFGPTMGTVRELDLCTTVIETNEGLYVYVPNSNLWGPPIKNHSRNRKRRMDLSVMIPYSDSLETGITVMKEIGKEEKRFLREPEPQVLIQSVADQGITIVLSAWAYSNDIRNINQDMVKIIKERIEAAGLHAQIPKRDIVVYP